MKIKLYNIINDSVERGVERGYRLAHKHTDSPDKSYLMDRIHTEIMNQICEYLDFGDEIDETL